MSTAKQANKATRGDRRANRDRLVNWPIKDRKDQPEPKARANAANRKGDKGDPGEPAPDPTEERGLPRRWKSCARTGWRSTRGCSRRPSASTGCRPNSRNGWPAEGRRAGTGRPGRRAWPRWRRWQDRRCARPLRCRRDLSEDGPRFAQRIGMDRQEGRSWTTAGGRLDARRPGQDRQARRQHSAHHGQGLRAGAGDERRQDDSRSTCAACSSATTRSAANEPYRTPRTGRRCRKRCCRWSSSIAGSISTTTTPSSPTTSSMGDRLLPALHRAADLRGGSGRGRRAMRRVALSMPGAAGVGV